MATLKEVAALAQVSLGTASKVMSGAENVSLKLRGRVERAAAQLNYRPNHVARSLKTRQTRTLGMVVSDLANPFFPEMVRGAEDAALGRGYVLMTFNTDDQPERERRIFDLLQARGVDGLLVVLALPKGGNEALLGRIQADTPVVCLDRQPESLAVDVVAVNNEASVAGAVAHLVERGYREIGLIGGRKDLYISEARERGFLSGLAAAGITPNPEWILEGSFRPESGYRLAKTLLGGANRPRALFVANMMLTAGVLKAMEELGLETPRDVAIATFDSIRLMDSFRPRLTAVVQPSYEIGRQGAELLMDRIEGTIASAQPIHLELPTELRIAESTGASVRCQAGAGSPAKPATGG